MGGENRTQLSAAFWESWTEASDRLLSAGFQDQVEFRSVVAEFGLTGEHFPDGSRRLLFRWFVDGIGNLGGVTPVTCMSALQKVGDRTTEEDLHGILGCQPGSMNMRVYAQMVMEHAQRYALYTAGTDARRLAMEIHTPLNGHLTEIRDRLGKFETTEKPLQFTSMDDLLAEPKPDAIWVVDELLPAGGTSLLHSRPKLGKSVLARGLASQVARGGLWLDRQCTRGSVLFLALEGSRTDIADHFERLECKGLPIHVHTERIEGNAISELHRQIDHYNAKLTVIDVLAKFIDFEDTNDYGKVTRQMSLIEAVAAATGCHILGVHHSNKAQTDPGLGALGSTAFTGCCDTILFLDGKPGPDPRTLETQNRSGRPINRSLLNFVDGYYTLGPNVGKAAFDEVKDSIRAALDTGAMGRTELLKTVGGKRGRAVDVLNAMVADGEIVRSGTGVRGDETIFGLPEVPF